MKDTTPLRCLLLLYFHLSFILAAALIARYVYDLTGGIKSTADPVAVALNKAMGNLANGKIAFESPIAMKLNETKTVEVRIAGNLQQDITQGLATSGSVTVKDIKVGPLMAASRKGSAFKITPITPEEQTLANSNGRPPHQAGSQSRRAIRIGTHARVPMREHPKDPPRLAGASACKFLLFRVPQLLRVAVNRGRNRGGGPRRQQP